MTLTATAVSNAKPKDKPYKLSDEKGLYLEVMPNGSKYWRLKYRFAGKEKRLALGVSPAVTLKEAREKRDEARRILEAGTDPATEVSKSAVKRAATLAADHRFEAIARAWLDNIRHKWTAAHYTDSLRRFEAHVFPEIGGRPIAEIKAPELLLLARKIESRGTIETAHKVVRAIGQTFRYAIATGQCEGNPAADLRGALRPKPKVQHMAALSAAELPELLRKIDAYATQDGGGDLQTQLALELLALSFVRTGELREATWDEFDIEAAEWRIPGERMKMGAPHVVPLSRQALATVRRLQELNGTYRLVFPGRNPKKPMSKNTVLFALYRMGYHGRMTGHGFRAVASTVLNEMNFNPDVIERQLAHAERNKVRAAYNRSEYLEERRSMMQTWADLLDTWKAGGKVTPLRKGAGKGKNAA